MTLYYYEDECQEHTGPFPRGNFFRSLAFEPRGYTGRALDHVLRRCHCQVRVVQCFGHSLLTNCVPFLEEAVLSVAVSYIKMPTTLLLGPRRPRELLVMRGA